MHNRRPLASVEHFDADQHVRNRQLQSRELNALAGETVRTGINRAAFDYRISKLFYFRLGYVLDVVRQSQRHWQTHSRKDWSSPQNGELTGRGFFEFEIGRPRLMGRGANPAKQNASEDWDEAQTCGTHSGSSPEELGTCFLGGAAVAGFFVTSLFEGGAGNMTVYLARISAYAFCHAVAFCSPSHAVFTSGPISSKAGMRP